MLSGIKLAKKWTASLDPVIVGWREFAERLLNEFSRNIHDGKGFKAIRDELSHGTPIPVEDASAAAICTALREFSEIVGQHIETQVSKFCYAATPTSIRLSCGADNQEVAPLWDFNAAQGVIGIYSTFDTDGVYYLCPSIGAYRNQRPENTAAFRTTFLSKDPTEKHFGQFVFEITRDIAGFCEDHSPPPYDFGEGEHAGVIFVTWTQASSQGNTHRTDMFRRGQDNRYEWFDVSANTWIGFSSFLRKIANWTLLARRVRIELDEQERRKQVAEMGTSQPTGGMKITAVLVEEAETPDDSSPVQVTPINLQARADNSCQPSKNFTTVYFVVGDAGMGKTDYLLTLARARAHAVETNPTVESPLYLFVSSTGRALSNLDDAINTSLSITHILNNHSAKVLCRNGLLVLIVDGFDELLGSSGYDNPLGSLEGWFKDLRGRGVMIASARSSYYMTRYRRSLSETTDLNVEHTVADIQPWTPEDTTAFLHSYGVPATALTDLSARDWRLLTIPFFAKAFATWSTTSRSNGEEPTGVFQIVVEQYLSRESTKIADQNNAPILSKLELQTLFSEFAEMMHIEGKRELEQSDLELCASAALGFNDIDKERPGLRRRLTSLCGLSVGEMVAGDSKFGFSHEVIFDCFLSLSLQRRCAAGVEMTYVNNVFSKAAINTAVIEWFVAANVNVAQSVLDILRPAGGTSSIWKKNVGALWTALLNHSGGMPPTLAASELEFQTVELSMGRGKQLTMRGAKIDQLKISRDAPIIDIKETSIKYLTVDEASTLSLLRGVAPEMIQKMQAPGSYCDTTASVRTVLEEAGVIAKQASAATLEWLDTANYFIESLVSRPDAPIVVMHDNLEPDSERLGWATRLGLAKWTQFLNRLTQCKLASWEPLVAKKQPKKRLVFHVSPAEISRRNSSIPGIADFWNS
ncbi:NACHT domain-containing protein [Pseudoduganella namucuonensis]|uniref:NACHT domain-containing protein n=2 Tax=Pseudoduganella namucuonensis TaxID=1035707 RepID=A0A1I7KWA2_9BURK|nr:NACHT domain-containing protein [Pseudoduganella namucuonensis]